MFEKRAKDKKLDQTIEELYLAQKNQERKDVFAHSFPANFYYYNLNSTQLEDPDKTIPFKINDKEISKLTLMIEEADRLTKDKEHLFDNDYSAALVIKYKDKSREGISLTLQQAKKLQTMFIAHAAVKGKMFYRKSERSLAWNEYTTNTIYQKQSEDPEKYYNGLYDEIIKII